MKKIYICDEAPMARREILDALNIAFQLIRGNSKPFGGCTVLLSGDYRQLPVVIPRASPAGIIHYSI